jgi:hypothetical protein
MRQRGKHLTAKQLPATRGWLLVGGRRARELVWRQYRENNSLERERERRLCQESSLAVDRALVRVRVVW